MHVFIQQISLKYPHVRLRSVSTAAIAVSAWRAVETSNFDRIHTLRIIWSGPFAPESAICFCSHWQRQGIQQNVTHTCLYSLLRYKQQSSSFSRQHFVNSSFWKEMVREAAEKHAGRLVNLAGKGKRVAVACAKSPASVARSPRRNAPPNQKSRL